MRVLAFLEDKVKHILKILLVQGLGVIFHLEKKKMFEHRIDVQPCFKCSFLTR